MTPETKRLVFRYGIAIDLVIMATGLGMLYPAGALFLAISFLAAVALSAWKGGFGAGIAATTGSVLSMLLAFGDLVSPGQAFAFSVVGVVLTFVIQSLLRAPIAVQATTDGFAFDAMPAVMPATEPMIEPIPVPATVFAPEPEPEPEPGIVQQPEAIAVPVLEDLPQPVTSPEPAAPAVEDVTVRPTAKRSKKRGAKSRPDADMQARLEREREEMRRQLEEAREAERRAADEMLRTRIEEERLAMQKALEEGEETIRRRLDEERVALQQAVEQQLADARAEMERVAQERIAEARREAEQRAVGEETLRKRLEEERIELQRKMDEQIAAARAQLEKEAQERVAEAERRAAATAQAPKRGATPQRSLFGTISGWLQRGQPQPASARKKIVGSGVAVSRPAAAAARTVSAPKKPAAAKVEKKPRLLLLERRRGTADTVVPRLRQRGIEVEVVERWIDAVDEIFRFKPDALLLDSELPDYAKVHKIILDQRPTLPVFVTGRSEGITPSAQSRYAGFVARPYDAEELATVAREAHTSPAQLLARQALPRVSAPGGPSLPRHSNALPVPSAKQQAWVDEDTQAAAPAPMPSPAPPLAARNDDTPYNVSCYHCRVPYDATQADWCSCLTKERTLLCGNCLMCFCKAPPSYKEKFWIEAPPRLFEKKMAEARAHQTPLTPNPSLDDVKRPLVMAVDDDEDIRVIVQRVCSNLNYGFVHASNGQEGLTVAREYRPNLILSDAFMPKLDGREMCRQLREEDPGHDTKMVVMTGLYTDTKYRSEALKRFLVDDYLAKPVAITELVNLLQRHLEGVSNLPEQEDLHAIHRQAIEDENDVPLADILDGAPEDDGAGSEDGFGIHEVLIAPPPSDRYEVACHSCSTVFDALTAEWCTCLGRDQTLVCGGCGTCFCRAPAAYKERFWMDAPSTLFERKMIGSKRNITLRTNPSPSQVKRPLILLVEDDENIQLIVRTVVTSMGFGFVVGANGQEGLALAREYNPDLILSDAFMPKLDGREMCRILKEDPATSAIKAIIMTGLYTDRKYRNEALDYFKVDDYVAKPLAVDDLIKLFKKHLPQEVHQTM